MRRALLAAVAFAFTGCPESRAKPKGNPHQLDGTAEDFIAPELPRAKVVLEDAYGGAHQVEVEVAADPLSRARGLMWRRELADGKGMLFIFAKQTVQSFWMRNTLIPLDMIFINEDQKIVGVVSRAEPKTLTSRTVGKPSLYVLEVPGGWAEKIGLRPGSTVKMDGLSMVQVVP